MGAKPLIYRSPIQVPNCPLPPANCLLLTATPRHFTMLIPPAVTFFHLCCHLLNIEYMSRSGICFFLIFTILPFCSYPQDEFVDKMMTVEEMQQDLDYLVETLETIHPNIYAAVSKEVFDRQKESIKSGLSEPMSRMTFARNVIPLVSSIQDAHTFLLLPGEERSAYLQDSGLIFPFSVRIDRSRLYITQNYSSDTTIPIYSEITTINDQPADSILNRMKGYVSAELEHYRDVRIEQSFGRLLWYLYDFNGRYTLTLNHGDQSSTRSVEGIHLLAYRAAIAEHGRTRNPKPYFFYQPAQPSTGIIEFNQMTGTKAFRHFLDSVFMVVEQEQISHLVIDIRQNGGGNSRLGDMLFSYITDKPYKMAEQMDIKISAEARKWFRKRVIKWYLYPLYPFAVFHPQARFLLFGKHGKIKSFPMNKERHPKKVKHKFNGQTYLLTGHYTFSSANMLAASYKCFGMGTVVGEETGGVLASFGDLVGFRLPNSGLNSYSSYKWFVLPCYRGEVQGVRPDVEIRPGMEDIRDQNDVVMEKVMALINEDNVNMSQKQGD